MANCAECGKKLGFLEAGINGLCTQCAYLANLSPNEAAELHASQEKNAAIESVTLTTETFPEGLKITRRIEIVTAECAFGMNMFKDRFAGVRDMVGGRSEAVQKTMRDARRTLQLLPCGPCRNSAGGHSLCEVEAHFPSSDHNPSKWEECAGN